MDFLQYMRSCSLCPRHCHSDRTTTNTGWCHAPALPKLALVSGHAWEEPPISGTKGSGTVFFSHCNLSCIFCQNHTISTEGYGQEISVHRLSEIFLEQQERGYHNLNLVSPTPYIPHIIAALDMARDNGFHLPVVYNTNGYETVESLQLLKGYVNIYLPDFKYFDNTYGQAFSNGKAYRERVQAAIWEMYSQVGKNKYDDHGLLQEGLIVRHLVLPGCYKDSCLILDWLKDTLGEDVCISLLNQYTPMYHAMENKQLSRRLTTFEYQKVVDHFFEIGLQNGFTQKRSSATAQYTPMFNLEGVFKEE